ncbi:MAG TPA: hypothetical protein PLD77_01390 [Candidatus Dojkabacteria bacterium]|nr:hypothetical protein [Candidatus Dojkabacteria bacterium]
MKLLHKKETIFLRNLFLTTVLGGIIGILNYLFNIFVVKYTDKSIFSIFTAALGIIYLVQIPATSIQSFLTKIVAKNDNSDLSRYRWIALKYLGIIGVLLSLTFFLFRYQISTLASVPVDIVIYLAVTLFFSFVSPISKAFLLGEERIITVNLLLLLETILKFAIGAIAIKMGGNIPLLILANSLPAVFTTIFVLPLLKVHRGGKQIETKFTELILITIFMLLLTIPYTIDLVLVNESFRAEYGAISLLGKLVYFSCVMTASVMFARVSNENKSANKRKSLLISLALAFCIGIVISIMYFIFTDLIISLTVGEQYIQVGKYLGIFGLCMTGFAVVYMIANYFISQNIYGYIFVLLFVSVLQILLFQFRNSSLNEVIQNQIIVYTTLTVLTVFILIYRFRKEIKNENER